MQLEFFGAANEVTGSCHILRVNGYRLLLDCGLVQGGRKAEQRNREDWPFAAAEIDAVILSHAHIDHSGRLPCLVKAGFSGPVHCHAACRDLVDILLRDSAFIGEMDAERENKRRSRKGLAPVTPLYTQSDVERTLPLLHTHRYDQTFEVVPGVQVRFFDAGHILGSAIIELQLTEGETTKRIVYSGDLGQYGTPILRDPAVVQDADLLILESTYGQRNHRSREQTLDEIGAVLNSAHADHGNILIPAFAVGRTQEILYELGTHFQPWQVGRWQIYLDSPLAIQASEIYWDYPHLYDAEALEVKQTQGMPPLPNLKLSRTTAESQAVNRLDHGAIVIAGSGMCTGGRIMHHLKHNIWRSQCHVLIVGYQAPGTLGRQLVDGRDQIKIHGEVLRVAARIHTVGGLSAHADQTDLLRWYGQFEHRPPVYLVHGEHEAASALKRKLTSLGASATIAKPGLSVDLAAFERQKPAKLN